MRYVYVLSMLMLSLVTAATIGRGGTSGGNGFFTKSNASFDFGLQLPIAWHCDGCDSHELTRTSGDQAWTLTVPGKSTWMKVAFIKDEKYTSVEALRSDITVRFGSIWASIDRGGFVGFTSAPNDEGTHANDATEYYLVIEGRVIRIEWHKSKEEPNEALELDAIKRSINRVSAPPQILYMRSESNKPYQVGDQACILIGVKDLRGDLDIDNLSDFTFAGQLPHWQRNVTIEWDDQRSQYRVCTKVTATFGPDGLHGSFVIRHDSAIDDSGESVSESTVGCVANAGQLTCISPGNAFGKVSSQQIPIGVVPVDNPNPHLEGPQVLGVKVDPIKLTLQLDVESPEGIYLAIVSDGDKAQVIFPDELGGEKSASIQQMTHAGWNTIDSIKVFDRNGVPTVLRMPSSASLPTVDSHLLYELVPWKGQARPTQIPIVNFRKGGGSR